MKLNIIIFAVFFAFTGKIFADESIKKFVVILDSLDNGTVAKVKTECRNGGTIIVTTRIPINFSVRGNNNAFLQQPRYDEKENCYVLCVEPTSTNVGGNYTKCIIDITAQGYKPSTIQAGVIVANQTTFFIVNPDNNSDNSQPANVNISGTVTDRKNGKPLSGVKIHLLNLAKTIFSDVNGNYKMENVPRDSVLEFSCRGYELTTRPVSRSPLNVSMRINESLFIINYGLALGVGNGITCGLAGIYSRYRFGKYFGVEAGIGISDFDNKFIHLSAGAKFYPYQSWALSIHYGNVSVERNDSYNSENGEFGIDGVKHLAGWSFLAGYDGSLPSRAFRKININTGIGFSYTNHVSLAWNIGVGFNF